MTTLHDRLSDLADEAPHSTTPHGLWAAGRRVHRRRRAGTVVVVGTALALLAGIGGLGWAQARVDVQPAGVTTELGLPDQVWAADPHLPGTDDVGPIGPLVAVAPTLREDWWGGVGNGLVGVSATGEYAFLDLPGAPADHLDPAPALSADGRYLAYWRTGSPSGRPGAEGEVHTGVAVYDTVEGGVVDLDVPSEHGIDSQGLVWAGRTLWFEVWPFDPPRPDGSSTRYERTLAWTPGSPPVEVALDQPLGLSSASGWRDAVVTVDGRGRVTLSRPAGSTPVGRLADRPALASAVFVSPNGLSAVAQVQDEQGAPAGLVAGRLGSGADDEIRLTPVPRSADYPLDVLLGWRDDGTVVGLDDSAGTGEAVVVAWDVGSGETTTLGYAEGSPPVVAAAALTGAVFDGPEPPHPLDPRLLGAAALVVVLLAAVAVLWWRRRVQR